MTGETRAKVKLNDVWQPVLEQDVIRRAKEMKEEVKDGLWVCESEKVPVHLELFVGGCVFVCLVTPIIVVFTTSFGQCLVIYLYL